MCSVEVEFMTASGWRVSLMREPLKPTRETPAMTVRRDIHLIGKGCVRGGVLCEKRRDRNKLVEPKTTMKEENRENADKKD